LLRGNERILKERSGFLLSLIHLLEMNHRVKRSGRIMCYGVGGGKLKGLPCQERGRPSLKHHIFLLPAAMQGEAEHRRQKQMRSKPGKGNERVGEIGR